MRSRIIGIAAFAVFATLCLPVAHGQASFISEDFSSASGATPPMGWSNKAIALGGVKMFWRFDNPGGRSFDQPLDGNFAIADSDWNGGATRTLSTLRSPTFDASTATLLNLSFDHQMRDLTTTIAVEAWDGAAWNAILNVSGMDIGWQMPTNTTVISEFFDITAAAGAAVDSRIRFTYRAQYDWWWAVDNVELVEPAPIDLSMLRIDNPMIDPLGCTNLSATQSVAVTFKNNGQLTLAAGTLIQLDMTVDGGTPITEFFVTPAALVPQQKQSYTFTATANLNSSGPHTLACTVQIIGDGIPANDTKALAFSTPLLTPLVAGAMEDFDSLPVFGDDVPLGWNNDKFDFASMAQPFDDQWYVANSPPLFGGAGVQFDHTTGFGNFMYLQDFGETSGINLVSPCIDTSAMVNPGATFYNFSDVDPSNPIDNVLEIDIEDVTSGGIVTMSVTSLPGNGAGSGWRKQLVDLSAFAPNVVRVIFRGRTDNFDFNDFEAIDDFAVEDLIIDIGQSPRPTLAAFDINSATNNLGFGINSGLPGPYLGSVVQGTPMKMEWFGQSNQAIACVYGALNRQSATYPNGIGQFDIAGPGVDGQGFPIGLGVFANGIQWSQTQVGLPFDSLFFVGPSGFGGLTILFPAFGLAPGTVITTFQVAVLSTAAPFVYISNAVELTAY